jgi:hypothetical protein
MEDGMNNKLLGCLVAGALGATLALSPSALARGGGGGGGHGGHGGGMGMHAMGGGMGMHAMGGGMGMHAMGGGMRAGPHFGGIGPRFSHVAFRDGFHHRFFHHRFHRFAFFGAPFAYASYDTCLRRVWTPYGPQWVNVCGDYGY